MTMICKLQQIQPPQNEILGYKTLEILAIYPTAIQAVNPTDEGYGAWCQSLLHLRALCIADGELTEISYEDIQFEENPEYSLATTS
jgi:hypothetical protein